MSRYLVTFLPGNPIPTRIKYVDDATTAPGVNDDAATLGVTVGSLWIDTVAPAVYICADASTGAAVWVATAGGGSGDLTSLHIDLSVSGAHTVDRADGATHDLTLTGNATLTLAGAVMGEATDLRIKLRQDGTGSRTVTWPGSVEWASGSAPTLQADPNAWDVIGLYTDDDGTTWAGFHAGSGGVTDHGALTGLGDDDHPQYATGADLTAHESTSHGYIVVMRNDITGPPEPVQNNDGDGWVYAEDI